MYSVITSLTYVTWKTNDVTYSNHNQMIAKIVEREKAFYSFSFFEIR